MLKKLTYKKKNILLAITAVAFTFIMYLAAISHTVAIAAQCAEHEKELVKISGAPEKLMVIKVEMAKIDKVLGNKNPLGENLQNRLLEEIVTYCQKKKIELREFPEPLIYTKDGNVIETSIVTVEADFIKILGLVYALEQSIDAGKVISVDYKAVKNKKTRKMELLADIFIQNIKKEAS